MGGGLSTACTVRQRRGRWFLCVDDDQKAQFDRGVAAVGPDRIEELLRELFRLHDLNKNGVLEEAELIKINEKIQVLHYGEDIDKEEVRRRYKDHFREKLDAQGHPVPYDVFRAYWLCVLQEHDRDLRVHEMILEQCIAEVESARQAFFIKAFQSQSDEPYLPTLSYHGGLPPTAVTSQLSNGAGRETPAWPGTPVADSDENCSFGPGTCQSFRSEFLPKPSLGDSAGRSIMDSFASDFVPSPAHREPSPRDGADVGHDRQLDRTLVPQPGEDTTAATTQMSLNSLDSDFVPSPSLAELHGRSGLAAQSSWASCAASGSQQPVQVPRGNVPECSHTKGERIEVWSNSKAAWVDGVVQEVFPLQSFAEGFTIPAGTVKVSFDSGVKWIMPEQVGSMLRSSRASLQPEHASSVFRRSQVSSQCSTALPLFAKGSAVQVWSDSRKAWLDGSVEESFAEAAQAEGFSVPAGTLKVRSAAGIKWVRPEQVSHTLRASVPDAHSQPHHMLSYGAARAPQFSKGEKIQVWSDSRQLWLGGSVLEVFPTASMAEGFCVPAGSLKVSSDAGVKWVSPAMATKVLRKVDFNGSVTTPDLKVVLAEVQRDPDRLQRHIDAVWAAAGCGSQGLPKDRAAWALEGLAMQFDVQLELEGRHLPGLQHRLELFCGHGDGCLTKAEFGELSHGLVSEVLRSL